MNTMCEEEQIRKIMLGIEDPMDDSDSVTLKDGDIVADWRIRALIGSGGFGNVYRVEHMRSGAIAALKMLTKFDEESKKRFELETEILQAIHASKKSARRHFPSYLGTGNHQIGTRTVPYVVTEFLEPLKLSDKDEKIGKFIEQMCDAVEELHRNGYLHRDIKTLNVMMRKDEDAEPEPVLIDFGGAIRIKDAENLDVRSRVSMEYGQIKGFGTIYSSAPEQLHGIATVRSDVYALGALINECFKGNPPENWQKIVQRATAPNPENRYQSVAEMRRAIARRTKLSRWVFVGRVAWICGICGFLITVFTVTGVADRITAYMNGLFAKRGGASAAPIEKLDTTSEAIRAFREKRYHDFIYLAENADQTQPEIQFLMGRCFWSGLAYARDRNMAVEWFGKAAVQGNAEAQNMLGTCYRMGVGVTTNLYEGVKWYRKAAEQGNAVAQFNLGLCYKLGKGVDDPVEAEKWFRKSAEQGNSVALFYLGWHCAHDSASCGDESSEDRISRNGITINRIGDPEDVKVGSLHGFIMKAPDSDHTLARVICTVEDMPSGLSWNDSLDETEKQLDSLADKILVNVIDQDITTIESSSNSYPENQHCFQIFVHKGSKVYVLTASAHTAYWDKVRDDLLMCLSSATFDE